MSTSLAEQLKRLQVPQTAAIVRGKKRASLLFDPKEAANLNRETVYQIGLDGFEELKNKNPAFSQFEMTLFHPASKEFERSVQSADSNKRLDKNIRKFLILLSPYFLLNCSHKALEWLIQRYYINEYNKEDLLMLILPYHETNIFVRVLQLLKLKDPSDKWHWLHPLQKSGVHLTKQALYNHAASNAYFIKFVSDFVLTAVSIYEKPSSLVTVFNFYCVVYTGAIEYAEKVQENHISNMLPVLLKGLSSNVPDFTSGSFIVISRLVAKATLSDKILDVIVKRLSKVQLESLKSELLLVLTILYQKQTQYVNIPSDAIKNLVEKSWVPKALQELIDCNYNIYPLLRPILQQCVKSILFAEENDVFIKFVDSIFTEVKMDERSIKMSINVIMESFLVKHKYSDKVKEWVKSYMQRLERQYPNFYDKIIRETLQTSSRFTAKQLKTFKKIMVIAMEGPYSLFEKLYHPDPHYRIEGVKYLMKKYNTLKEKEKDLIKTALTERLNDDLLTVVRETLISFKSMLPDVIGKETLKYILFKLLQKCYSDEDSWWKISYAVLDVFCHNFDDSDILTFLNILPFLLPTSEGQMKVAKQILSSPYAKTSKFLKPIIPQLEEAKHSDTFFTTVYNNLSSVSEVWDVKTIVSVLSGVKEENRSTLHKYLVTLVLSNILPKDIAVDVSYLVLQIFETYLETSNVSAVKKKSTVSHFLTLAKQNKFPLQGFLLCLENVILKTRKLNGKIGNVDLSNGNETNNFYLKLLQILFEGTYTTNENTSLAYAHTMKIFLEHFCGDSLTKVEFLLNISICENEKVDETLQLKCLRTISSLLKDESKPLTDFIGFESVVVPYLLIVLTSTNSELRNSAIYIIQHILATTKTKNEDDYSMFLKKIIKSKREILMDNEQIPLVVYNILTEDVTEASKNTINKFFGISSSFEYPVYVCSGMLKLLAFINDFEKLHQTSRLAVKILEETTDISTLNLSKSEILYRNILRLDVSACKDLVFDSTAWQMVSLAIKNDTTVVYIDKKKKSCPAVLLLNHIDENIFAAFKSDIKAALCSQMIKLITVSQNPDVLQAGSHVFKRIELDADLILDFLVKMKEVQCPKLDESKRKRRISVIPTADILDTLEWKEGVTVLEICQEKKKLTNFVNLFPILFDLLKKCLDFDEQANVEYPKQLILSTILHLCGKIEKEMIPEKAFNMELVVQCIRASQNPQTHHHALLLLSYAASVIPDQVLHHIIAVFTFMGSSVLRHDDAYSFQIISKIIDTIIPLLVTDNSMESIVKVLRVFVDAILDIPEHRRMSMFTQLLTRLNLKDNLYLFLLLVFEAHVVHGHLEKAKVKNNRLLAEVGTVQKRLEIAASICHKFTPEVIIHTCIKLLEYLRKLPDDKEESMETDEECCTFDINHHTAKQFRHYKYTLVVFISNFLSSKEFVEKIASSSDNELLHLESLFKMAIVNILTYIQHISKVADKNVNTPQAQYWKVMLHHTYDILDSLNALLTPQMFLLVVRGLMVHTIGSVRRRALELLNVKLQNNAEFFSDCDESELQALIPPLLNIIKVIEEEDEIETDQEVIIQTALLSLKLLVRLLAPNNPDKFLYILDFITDLIRSPKVQENVLASVVLCLAELCTNLRAHAIPSLNKFMPSLVRVLRIERTNEMPSLLLLSIVTALQKVLENLALFLSPYLEKLLFEVSSLMCKWRSSMEDEKLTPFINKISDISKKIGTGVPPRVLIPIIENCYANMIQKRNFDAVGPLMSIFAENVNQLAPADLQANMQQLTAFFLSSLQFRADEPALHEEANKVEKHVVKALLSLILKLSESSFRPLYYKLFDWAVRTDVKSERVITFYNFSHEIANCLKGLFVLFAGHFLNNAASLLDACNVVKKEELYFAEEEKNILLIEYILKTLHAAFLYDTQRFINKERFDVLMQPIVDQMENTLGGEDALEKRAQDVLSPCIVQFVVAIGDDALWKQLNYQIMLKTRHASAKVRLVALDCLVQIVRKVGEDFLPLLPETIPFLAELLEDDEENVEKACQKAVQEMEKIVGEPLQKYF